MNINTLRYGAVTVLLVALGTVGGALQIGDAGGPAPAMAATTSPRPSLTSQASTPPSGPELVYVANTTGPVTAYPAGSTGTVSPVRSLLDPGTTGTFWGPWGVAFDSRRNAYVQSFLSNATSFVYPPGATQPSRIFRVTGPDSRAIAVDPAGYAYVASGQVGNDISVAAPGAAGVPGTIYQVPEVRRITTDETAFHPWPSVLTTDTSGHVIAAVVRAAGNAVEVFTGGPTGTSTPVRVITGPHTGLGSCSATCDQLAVTYSPLTGRLYVAVSQGQQTRINVYAGDATGDAAPVRVITGPATALAGQVVTGIAGSPVDGSIYVVAKPAVFNTPGTVLVFDRLATGNVAPRRSFTDVNTGLVNAMGIAVTN